MREHEITREEALNWRPWSSGDLRLIQEHLDRMGAVRFIQTRGLIKCRDANDRPVADLHPGYIDFKRAWIPEDFRPGKSWLILSTFQQPEGGEAAPWSPRRSAPPASWPCPSQGSAMSATDSFTTNGGSPPRSASCVPRRKITLR